jgi:hypothetical protein
MRRNHPILAVAVFALCTLPLAAQESAQPQREPAAPSFRLGSRAEAEAVYKALSTLNRGERKELYASLDADLYPTLWTIHFERFSAAHPELTGEQRALIAQALDFVSSGIFDVPRERGDWQLRVHAPAAHLASEATRLLGPQLATALLSQIGGPLPDDFAGARIQTDAKNTIATNVTCECVSSLQDCGDPLVCVTRPTVRCTFYNHCGPFFLDACDGLCQ